MDLEAGDDGEMPNLFCFRRRSTFKCMEKFGGEGLLLGLKDSIKKGILKEKGTPFMPVNPTFQMIKHLRSYMDDEQSVLNDVAAIIESITFSTGRTLYITNPNEDEIFRYQRSKSRVSHKIGPGSILAAFTAYTRKICFSRSHSEDKRFPLGSGCATRKEMDYPVMSIPVVTPDDRLLAVIEVYRDSGVNQYDADDELIAVCVANWLGAAIMKHREAVELVDWKNFNDEIIAVMVPFFTLTPKTRNDIVQLIYKMSFLAKEKLKAEQAIFYRMIYVDKNIADIYEDTGNGQGKWPTRKQLSDKHSLIKQVIYSGKTFNLDVNELKDFPHRDESIHSALCMPVKCSEDNVGILALFNKISKEKVFTNHDEKIFNFLNEYFAMVLHFDAAHEKSEELHRKVRNSKELLLHQLEPCPHDHEWAIDMWENNTHRPPVDFLSFEFYPKNNCREYLVELSLILVQSTLGNQFMKDNDMIKFMLMLSHGYRSNYYHNFEHAFTVSHCMMNIVKRNKTLFSELERVSLIIAAFCHDIDHPGFTNSFLKATSNYLVELYEDSILENHHSFMAHMFIKHCRIFSYLKSADYKTMMNDIYQLIVATDLSVYFKKVSTITKLVVQNNFSLDVQQNRMSFKGIMMTACDLSGMYKPFKVAQLITKTLYKEFYNQGDEEKARGLTPMSMMDRSKSYQQPNDQITFISLICIPCLDVLLIHLPCAEMLISNCKELLKHWTDEQKRIKTLYGL